MKKEEAMKIYNAAQRLMESIDAGAELIPHDIVEPFSLFRGNIFGYKVRKDDFSILNPYLCAKAVHKYMIGGVQIKSEYELPIATTIINSDCVYITIPKDFVTYFVSDIGRMVGETVCGFAYKRIKLGTLYEDDPKEGRT